MVLTDFINKMSLFHQNLYINSINECALSQIHFHFNKNHLFPFPENKTEKSCVCIVVFSLSVSAALASGNVLVLPEYIHLDDPRIQSQRSTIYTVVRISSRRRLKIHIRVSIL